MSYKKIPASELLLNPFEAIGKKWMLITGGTKEKFNTMTASWGQLGVLWNKNVLTCYIRTNRYTYEFIDSQEFFTASILADGNQSTLALCGSKSGRDCDKVKETGLTPFETDNGISFEESELIFECRKLHSQELLTSGFTTDEGYAEQFYANNPSHIQFIAEITAVYVKE